MMHWIRFQDDSQSVPQLNGLYKAGYDRLSGGFGLSQFIGYETLALNGRINLIAGFELLEGFTSNLRSINYDTQTKDDRSRFDMTSGLRIGLILPFYKYTSGEEKEIFY